MPDQVVAGSGAVDADEDLAPEPGGDLPDRGGQHFQVAGEGAEGHCRRGAACPGTRGCSGTSPPAGGSRSHLPGGSRPSLAEWAVTRVSSMSMMTHRPGSSRRSPATGTPPGWPRSASTRAPGLARAGRSGPARTACRPGPAPAHRRAARRGPQHRGEVGQHRDVAHARGASAIAAAIETSTIPRSSSGDVPSSAVRAQAAVSGLVRLTTGTTKRAVAHRTSTLVWSIGLAIDGL